MFVTGRQLTARRAAVRAGATTLVAFFLTTALFVSPLLAAHTDFGHTHPAGTPGHTHALSSVLGPALEAPTTAVASPSALSFFFTVSTPPLVFGFHANPANGIRAPPLTR